MKAFWRRARHRRRIPSYASQLPDGFDLSFTKDLPRHEDIFSKFATRPNRLIRAFLEVRILKIEDGHGMNIADAITNHCFGCRMTLACIVGLYANENVHRNCFLQSIE